MRDTRLMAWRHGTAYGYDKGCRCDDCRTAKLAKRRDARARMREKNGPSYRRELATCRAIKERYRGRCKLCGAATTGSNGPAAAPDVCGACAPSFYGQAAKKRGRGPTIGRMLALLETPRTFSEISGLLGITHGHTSQVLNRLVRYGFVERISRGVYKQTDAGRSKAAA